jgi:hypothetical protein
MKFFSTTLALLLTLTLVPLVATGETRDIRQSALDTERNLGEPSMAAHENVALGQVPGAFVITKFGYNAEVTDADEESIWDVPDLGGPERCNTVVTDTATALFLSSSAAGDATETVMIEGLTTGFVPQTLEVTLGATAATTGTVPAAAGTWLRVNRMYATSADLTGDTYLSDAATDTDTDGVPDDLGTIVAAISAGENQTLQSCYTVPADYVAILTQVCVSNTVLGGANALDFRVRITDNAAGATSRTQVMFTQASGTTTCTETDPNRIFTEKTDIEITGAGTTQAATTTFGLILLPEGYYKD